MRPSERTGRPIGMAGLTCWVGRAMYLWVTALLCCYLVGVLSWDARIWSAVLPAGELGVPAGVARRAAMDGGLVLSAFVCGGRGWVSSELVPPPFFLGGWQVVVCVLLWECVFLFYTIYHGGPRSRNCGAEPRRNK